MDIKKIKKILIAFSLIACIGLGMFSQFSQVKAAGYSVSAANNGNGTATVTVSGAVFGKFSVSVNGITKELRIDDNRQSGTDALYGSASAVFDTGTGTFNVTVTPISVTDADYNLLTNVYNGSVTVTKPEAPSGNQSSTNNSTPKAEEKPKEDTRSKDSTLSSLTVSLGELSPAFTAETTEYTVSLPAETTTFSIEATANDAKASVSGTGEKELKVGENVFEIVVTAENGSTRTYKITANVDEKPLVYLEYSGKNLGVVRNLDDAVVPDDFEEVTISINDTEVKGWHSNLKDLTILFLIDDNGNKGFYVYDETKGIVSSFRKVALFGKNLVILDVPKELQDRYGMKFTELEIDGTTLQGWSFENEEYQNYYLIYVMNEQGEMKYYLYEESEQSLQLYADMVPMTMKAYEEQMNQQKMLQYIMYGVVLVLSGTTIAGFVLWNKAKKGKVSFENQPKVDIDFSKFEE